jgi:hypothetical protein
LSIRPWYNTLILLLTTTTSGVMVTLYFDTNCSFSSLNSSMGKA